MPKAPSYINIQNFNYNLPEDRIAKYPLELRDRSKLLFYNGGKISGRYFFNLPEILSGHHHLVFNDTKVIQARLLFQKSTGAAIEIFLLEPWIPAEYSLSFSSDKECVWKCLVGNAKKWKTGILKKEIKTANSQTLLNAEMTGSDGNYYYIRFFWENRSYTFSDIIIVGGKTPIPPYLNRPAEVSDTIRYQTIYSKNEGSVAAPTAGLHFTDEVIKKLKDKGVSFSELTLHVGAGTFIPVKSENAAEHCMHTEHIYLHRESIESLYFSDKKIIAVGTTSVRTLESLYHIAATIENYPNQETEIFLDQWDAYHTESALSRKDAMGLILAHMDKLKTKTLRLSTRIMIAPGYTFRMTDGIITNFHQPASTLLLLISAFTGEDWKKIYQYASDNGYRFLSYGDSSLLVKESI